ncbi:Hypothetical predicted protein [Olea europaea subsp. europaea]|uniref:Transmembrane protein n=1 Tax=Olea europaea subsp. europaea TaxID=158383 RepID=A0A8S0T0Q4_OLEEU|nr:Hypothetical predicted protein [Olea europaea subsp. europaea]
MESGVAGVVGVGMSSGGLGADKERWHRCRGDIGCRDIDREKMIRVWRMMVVIWISCFGVIGLRGPWVLDLVMG